jgi:uncharacterized protein
MTDLRHPGLHVQEVINALELHPHPEGGYYRELWRDVPHGGGRGTATSILFLLAAGQRSHWHRVDATEIWLWQAGSALSLSIEGRRRSRLGPDLAAGEWLQATVPAHAWQAAEPCGAWSLVSCIVAPAFEFSGFELAPEGWTPG